MSLRFVTLVVVMLLCAAADVHAQFEPYDVVLRSSNSAGVPVHPVPGDRTYERWPNGTFATVTEIDGSTGWRRVERKGAAGWVVDDYVIRVIQPKLVRPGFTQEKAFRLTVSSANHGARIVIEGSADMVQWTPLQTNSFAVLHGLVFEDANRNRGRRFYRAISEP